MATNAPTQAVKEPEDRLLTPRRSRALVLLLAIAAGAAICYLLAAPFISPLTWALVLAIAFQPAHRTIAATSRHPSLGAGISVALAVLVVAIPLLFVAERLVNEAAKGAQATQEMLRSGAWRDALAGYPSLARAAEWVEGQLDLPAMVGNAAAWLTNASASFVRISTAPLINLVLTFYFLFYFLRDGREALAALKDFSPLTSSEMDRLYRRVTNTVYAIVLGALAVAAVQGALGGLMFWLLGLPAPLLWGLVMALLSIVPVLGSFLVWIPAALYLAIGGDWGKALILVAWGALVIGTVDNLLRPVLVGNRLQMHTLTAFITMLGGLFLFGPAGLVLGPVVFTVTLLLLQIWREHNAKGTD